LLRTGELLNILVSDCHFTSTGALLHLRNTKGGQRRLLADESVIVEDNLTLWALHQLVKKKAPGDFLVGISPPVFRTRWNHMKRHMGLTHWRFLPYGLRRGGATPYGPTAMAVFTVQSATRWCNLVLPADWGFQPHNGSWALAAP